MSGSVPSDTLVPRKNRRRADRRRKGIINAALKIFDLHVEGLPISESRRSRCHECIQSAKRPTTEARNRAHRIHKDAASAAQELDLSDVQVLRVELIRKWGVVPEAFDGELHKEVSGGELHREVFEGELHKLAILIVTKNLTKKQFAKARRNLLRRDPPSLRP